MGVTKGRFVPVCKNFGKRGTIINGTFAGSMPGSAPIVSGKCPAHPSGNQNMPHVPQWMKL